MIDWKKFACLLLIIFGFYAEAQKDELSDVNNFPKRYYEAKSPFLEGNYDPALSFYESLDQDTHRLSLEGFKMVNLSYKDMAKGIGYGCDEEAFRGVREAPHFNPEQQDRVFGAAIMMLPIVYRLPKKNNKG